MSGRLIAAPVVLLLTGLHPGIAAAQQRPTQPGWPQPVHNNRLFAFAILNQNEWRASGNRNAYRWDGEGWYGGNLNRVWFRTEGLVSTGSGAVNDGELQVLYSRAVSTFFDLQAGARYDVTPTRGWAEVGVEGLAPLFFEVGGFAFASSDGRYALRGEASYDLPLTQRLFAQPQVEVDWSTRGTAASATSAGGSEVDAGLRLRYEIRREVAPYVAVTYHRSAGPRAGLQSPRGAQTSLTAGLRLWF